ncbi:unnamed protein product [Phytophthora lilii]|uniref:Unnamed protein product n=1 Tax=Phytophthora lilii TaxID=2077276 RepID=A0A9W6TDS1_9STRA|nr:unnamed protein product [Phytophthora lilii]
MAANESEVFTASEKEQLTTMLGVTEAQVDKAVAVAQEIFRDAAAFGQVDRNLLPSRGVEEDVLRVVEKTWRKKGSPVAQQIAAFNAVETSALVLQKTDWRLHLEMGNSKLSGQSQPTAIFQLELADKSSPTNEVRMEFDALPYCGVAYIDLLHGRLSG